MSSGLLQTTFRAYGSRQHMLPQINGGSVVADQMLWKNTLEGQYRVNGSFTFRDWISVGGSSTTRPRVRVDAQASDVLLDVDAVRAGTQTTLYLPSTQPVCLAADAAASTTNTLSLRAPAEGQLRLCDATGATAASSSTATMGVASTRASQLHLFGAGTGAAARGTTNVLADAEGATATVSAGVDSTTSASLRFGVTAADTLARVALQRTTGEDALVAQAHSGPVLLVSDTDAVRVFSGSGSTTSSAAAAGGALQVCESASVFASTANNTATFSLSPEDTGGGTGAAARAATLVTRFSNGGDVLQLRLGEDDAALSVLRPSSSSGGATTTALGKVAAAATTTTSHWGDAGSIQTAQRLALCGPGTDILEVDAPSFAGAVPAFAAWNASGVLVCPHTPTLTGSTDYSHSLSVWRRDTGVWQTFPLETDSDLRYQGSALDVLVVSTSSSRVFAASSLSPTVMALLDLPTTAGSTTTTTIAYNGRTFRSMSTAASSATTLLVSESVVGRATVHELSAGAVARVTLWVHQSGSTDTQLSLVDVDTTTSAPTVVRQRLYASASSFPTTATLAASTFGFGGSSENWCFTATLTGGWTLFSLSLDADVATVMYSDTLPGPLAAPPFVCDAGGVPTILLAGAGGWLQALDVDKSQPRVLADAETETSTPAPATSWRPTFFFEKGNEVTVLCLREGSEEMLRASITVERTAERLSAARWDPRGAFARWVAAAASTGDVLAAAAPLGADEALVRRGARWCVLRHLSSLAARGVDARLLAGAAETLPARTADVFSDVVLRDGAAIVGDASFGPLRIRTTADSAPLALGNRSDLLLRPADDLVEVDARNVFGLSDGLFQASAGGLLTASRLDGNTTTTGTSDVLTEARAALPDSATAGAARSLRLGSDPSSSEGGGGGGGGGTAVMLGSAAAGGDLVVCEADVYAAADLGVAGRLRAAGKTCVLGEGATSVNAQALLLDGNAFFLLGSAGGQLRILANGALQQW